MATPGLLPWAIRHGAQVKNVHPYGQFALLPGGTVGHLFYTAPGRAAWWRSRSSREIQQAPHDLGIENPDAAQVIKLAQGGRRRSIRCRLHSRD